MRPHATGTDNPIDFPADAREEYFSAEYVYDLQREVARLKQEVAFLEDWRAVWAPVIRQHQGVEWKRYDWRNIALTMLTFFVIVLSYAVITGVCK